MIWKLATFATFQKIPCWAYEKLQLANKNIFARFLKDLNRATSCSVILTIVLNTLHACVIDFTAVLV